MDDEGMVSVEEGEKDEGIGGVFERGGGLVAGFGIKGEGLIGEGLTGEGLGGDIGEEYGLLICFLRFLSMAFFSLSLPML